MANVSNPTPATLEEAVALLGTLATEKRLLELRIKDLEHRLFGSASEKRPIEDRQLALIDEVFDHPEPATTQDVVVDPDIEKRSAKKPVRRPLPDHLEVVEERMEPADKTCSHCGREQCLVREEFSERLDLIPARLIRRRTVSAGSGCLAERCAAADPNLHPGQLDRVAALELEATGRLTVEVDRRAPVAGRPRATRNHHTLTPEWEPWGSPHGYTHQDGRLHRTIVGALPARRTTRDHAILIEDV